MQNKSLSTFFATQKPTDLTSCDREEVHLSGLIQNVGALILIDPATRDITACSENAPELLGLTELTFAALAETMPEVADAIRTIGQGDDVFPKRQILDYQSPGNGNAYNAIVTGGVDQILLEFTPAGKLTPEAFRKQLRRLREGCARIMASETFRDALQVSVDLAREITGFSRVKIYQFLPDWSGHVIAESRTPNMDSFVGLHFPDTDIPKQARALFDMLPYRIVATVKDDTVPLIPVSASATSPQPPPDLSWSILRSCSKMHTEYLRNMGVEATFSTAIHHQGELWGLIACHNDKPGFVPVDNWDLIRDIAETLSAKLIEVTSKETSAMMSEMRVIESSIASKLRSKGSVDDVLQEFAPVMRRFLKADGFAFQYGGTIFGDGKLPPAGFIKELISSRELDPNSNDYFQTTALHRHVPEAAQYKDSACGVLIQPIQAHRTCQLIWFRGPASGKVNWAGNPQKQSVVDKDGVETLSPRNSFETWVEKHSEHALAWTPAEINVAREVLKEILDIVATQLILGEKNFTLRTFAHAAAHDIKSPLRTIDFALDLISEDQTLARNPLVIEAMEIASTSSDRLRKLVSQMTEHSILEDKLPETVPLDLVGIIADVRKMVHAAEIESGATFDVQEEFPRVTGRTELITTLLLNLIGNSIKYRSPERPLKISIGARDEGKAVSLWVRDNGTGIEPQYARQVFEPFKRLVGYDEVEGSGLGLSICRRIADLHDGEIAVNSDYPGPGTEILITLPKAAIRLENR